MDGGTAASQEVPLGRARRRTSFTGVLGELLITLGIIVLLYVAWQLWIGDMIYGAQNNAAGQQLSEEWDASADEVPVPEPATPGPTGSPDPSATNAPGQVWEPVVLGQPENTEVFGIMRIPRFGADYATMIAGGVTRAGTLDHIGIGHYPDTEMPGQVGNFALAAHRTTFGAPFARLAELHVGDAIVIETPVGWYTYRFRNLEYVQPSEINVLEDVPQAPGTPADGRYLTMTSCSPKFSLAERIVGYSTFEGFRPRAEGAPTSLTEAAA